MENHVKYQAAAYAKTDDTLYVNLYMPTTVTWDEMGVSVKQETNFPSEHSKLTVNGSGDFTMKLRVPYWATAGFEVKVNGETICTNPEVSTYVEIDRAWSDGDVVEITMPYTLHLDKTPDKVDGSTVASLMYATACNGSKRRQRNICTDELVHSSSQREPGRLCRSCNTDRMLKTDPFRIL